MKNQNTHIIIESNLGLYWAGLNTWTDQIRKAQFYNSEKKADEAAISAIEKWNKTRPDEDKITSYKFVTVTFNIIGETAWKNIL